ncbi:SDR family NAD(P)-dependent oxidoreductase [Streptococcus zalophi]|uniref:SDR family NAD(P)-dependent oxidoreductase n=1 Tax=Streptococcus zalophi TaxID=640031 RepID=UPI00215CF3F2|nr:SDR family oxidoreductase [Streptococcus zalophi]MCR8967417.1 SDR family oxidoreductase [Streptococcus zalophi]
MNTTKRVIVITGASGGLAQSIVKQLPTNDQLILLSRQKEKLQTIYGSSENYFFKSLDIRDDKAISDMVDDIYDQFGRIDIMINNAGFGEFKDFTDFTADEMREMFDVNTFATIQFSKLVGQRMAQKKHGHIINIASMAGLIASNKSSIYSATKFAVIGFSNALRLELAKDNVYVTTVNPGPIETNFFDRADPSGSYLKTVEKFTLKPDVVAQKIIKNMGKNKRDINLPLLLNIAHKCYVLFPKLSDMLARKVFNFK